MVTGEFWCNGKFPFPGTKVSCVHLVIWRDHHQHALLGVLSWFWLDKGRHSYTHPGVIKNTWQSILPKFCEIFWRLGWHFYRPSGIPTFYLAFYLTCYLAFDVTYILTFYRALHLDLSGILSCRVSGPGGFDPASGYRKTPEAEAVSGFSGWRSNVGRGRAALRNHD